MSSRKPDADTKISATDTVQDWYNLRAQLDGEFKPEPWRKAVGIFSDRIQNRFFEPLVSGYVRGQSSEAHRLSAAKLLSDRLLEPNGRPVGALAIRGSSHLGTSRSNTKNRIELGENARAPRNGFRSS